MRQPHEQDPRPTSENRSQGNAARLLAKWYDTSTTYVDLAKPLDSKTVEVVWEVSDFQCNPVTRPNVHGLITVEGDRVTNRLIVDEVTDQDSDEIEQHEKRRLHTAGHFNPNVGVSLFPGYMGMGMILAAASQKQEMLLTGFKAVKYLDPAFPGDTVTGSVFQQTMRDRTITNGVVNVNEDPHKMHTFIREMELTPASERGEDGFYLGQHQEFEVAAQMVGAAVMALYPELQGEDVFPAFRNMGEMKRAVDLVRTRDLLKGTITVEEMAPDNCTVGLKVTRNGGELYDFKALRLWFLTRQEFIDSIASKRSA